MGQTDLSKQCRPRSDATCGIWSGSTLFATFPVVLFYSLTGGKFKMVLTEFSSSCIMPYQLLWVILLSPRKRKKSDNKANDHRKERNREGWVKSRNKRNMPLFSTCCKYSPLFRTNTPCSSLRNRYRYSDRYGKELQCVRVNKVHY